MSGRIIANGNTLAFYGPVSKETIDYFSKHNKDSLASVERLLFHECVASDDIIKFLSSFELKHISFSSARNGYKTISLHQILSAQKSINSLRILLHEGLNEGTSCSSLRDVCEVIRLYPNLKHFWLNVNGIVDKSTSQIFWATLSQSQLESLTFFVVEYEENQLDRVSQTIIQMSCLSELHVPPHVVHSRLSDESWNLFCGAIQNVATLKIVSVDLESVAQNYKETFLDVISKSKSIEDLCLSHLTITEKTSFNFLNRISCLELNYVKVDNDRTFDTFMLNVCQSHQLRFFTIVLTGFNGPFVYKSNLIAQNGLLLACALGGCIKDESPFRETSRRNSKNLEKTKELCTVLSAIKKFKRTPMLDFIAKDCVTLFSRFLLKTWPDFVAWS
jgi:hypothetical protein